MFVWSGEQEASISLLVDQEVGEVHLEGGGGGKSSEVKKRKVVNGREGMENKCTLHKVKL